MRLLRLTILTAFCICTAQCVLNGKDIKRREAGFDSYGPPPRPQAQYGPPPQQQQHIPHREYGVPQQIPFQEYGPPALKYGPPKLNFLGGGGGGGGGSSGLHEQIKTHFGVPKPFYGPPHIQHKPAPQYGPPPPQYGPPPAPQYGPPPPQYGPPRPQYGPPPPLKLQHRPAPNYGPPPQKPHFHIPSGPPQSLPAPHPAPLFKPAHQPATSYGPPASGPLNLPPKPVYETPPNYGPPPLPINVPGPHSFNGNRLPEKTIILSGHEGPAGGPVKQVQIQIDASGHTHSVSGSQVPFHTACDGWKPIPAPVGAYVEENHIETQDGYSHVNQAHSHGNSQGQSFVTQYSVGGGATGGGGSGGGSIIDGLSDEQLVAVALQGEGGNIITGPGGDEHLNNIDSNLQLNFGSTDDSYSKPPGDSYAPGSVHAHKYQTIDIGSGPGLQLPPAPGPGPQYGPPPPQFAALTSSQNIQSHSQSHSHSQSNSNVNIQYGGPSGNPRPVPQHGAGQPNKPVAYRSPVPAGLLESIGATVQHLDQFGVKPAQQAPTYIPPATHEIPVNGGNHGPPPPAPQPQVLYGTPLNQAAPPQIIVQQQLPQSQSGPAFGPPQRPIQSYGPPPQPQGHYQPGPPPIYLQQQQQHQQHQQHLQQQHQVENSYSASQYTKQYVQSQGLPLLQQGPRFNQQPYVGPGPQTVIVHDCGHGPNLVSNTGYQVQHQQHQQQQQQQTFGSVSAASDGAYNAIAQSIPVAEQHTQFLSVPSDSYGPPPSGNDFDFDHSGYASQKSAVAALPDGTDPQQLPGLDGLNVISAQKSESIKLGAGADGPHQNFEVQFGSSLSPTANGNGNGNGNGQNNAALVENGANHEEILSQGLLQSILTAIEQPQSSSHRAQSRSDEQHKETDDLVHDHEQDQESESESESEQQHSASNRVEVIVDANGEEHNKNKITKIEPIIPAEEEDAEN